VVPGRAFVEVQRLHAPDRAGRQVVGVEVEHARARAVDGSVQVGTRGLGALAKRLDLADLELATRGAVKNFPIRCSTVRPIS
jgi:hypothetical protein